MNIPSANSIPTEGSRLPASIYVDSRRGVKSDPSEVQDRQRVALISEDQLKQLKNSDLRVPAFSFKGQILQAKVVKVYDGDTITVNFWFDNKLQRFSIRMEGYDSPEKRSKDTNERKLASVARNALASLVLNKVVKLKCGDFDKYGRLLGVVFIEDPKNMSQEINVNEYMESQRYGVDYHGETKEEFDPDNFSNSTPKGVSSFN